MKKLKFIIALVCVAAVIFGVVQFIKTQNIEVNTSELVIMYLIYLLLK